MIDQKNTFSKKVEYKILQLKSMSMEDITNSAYYSVYYAIFIKKDRFKEGETVISTSSIRSLDYAVYVLKGRFKIGEDTIKKSINSSRHYINAMEKLLTGDELIVFKLEF